MEYNGYLNLNIKNLTLRIAEGYIRRSRHSTMAMSLYNYSEKAQYGNVWDNEILNCRGLVLRDDDFSPVNGVFPKFFNANPDTVPNLSITSITEKMDGSFISLFKGLNGTWVTATRGSFESDQALWAAKFVAEKFDLDYLTPEWSYIFEAIYPENRVVVDYGERRDLVLLGARRLSDGHFMSRVSLNNLADNMGMTQPKLFTFGTVDEIFAAAKAIAANQEGWVVEYEDSSRLKFKGEAYVLAHRVMTGVTFKRVLEAIALGKLDEMIEGIPDEFLDTVKAYRKEIEDRIETIKMKVFVVMLSAPVQGITQPEKEFRKAYAQWAFQQKDSVNPHYLLNYDKKDYIEQAAYKNEFEDRLSREAIVNAVIEEVMAEPVIN